jgi:hypothetical protein
MSDSILNRSTYSRDVELMACVQRFMASSHFILRHSERFFWRLVRCNPSLDAVDRFNLAFVTGKLIEGLAEKIVVSRRSSEMVGDRIDRFKLVAGLRGNLYSLDTK